MSNENQDNEIESSSLSLAGKNQSSISNEIPSMLSTDSTHDSVVDDDETQDKGTESGSDSGADPKQPRISNETPSMLSSSSRHDWIEDDYILDEPATADPIFNEHAAKNVSKINQEFVEMQSYSHVSHLLTGAHNRDVEDDWLVTEAATPSIPMNFLPPEQLENAQKTILNSDAKHQVYEIDGMKVSGQKASESFDPVILSKFEESRKNDIEQAKKLLLEQGFMDRSFVWRGDKGQETLTGREILASDDPDKIMFAAQQIKAFPLQIEKQSEISADAAKSIPSSSQKVEIVEKPQEILEKDLTLKRSEDRIITNDSHGVMPIQRASVLGGANFSLIGSASLGAFSLSRGNQSTGSSSSPAPNMQPSLAGGEISNSSRVVQVKHMADELGHDLRELKKHAKNVDELDASITRDSSIKTKIQNIFEKAADLSSKIDILSHSTTSLSKNDSDLLKSIKEGMAKDNKDVVDTLSASKHPEAKSLSEKFSEIGNKLADLVSKIFSVFSRQGNSNNASMSA